MYYDKQGNKISNKSWSELHQNLDYRVVKQEELPNGKLVSTIWLGLDHSFSDKVPPIIFETMVFPSRNNFSELSMRRYSTEEEAIKGHEELVKEYE